MAVSPNGKFLVGLDPAAVTAIAPLTDIYYGKSPKVVEDILMTRVSANLDAKKWDVALEAMDDLEQRGSAVGENFHFVQIDALVLAGRKAEAQKKAGAFIDKYGDKSAHYRRMIEILAQ